MWELSQLLHGKHAGAVHIVNDLFMIVFLVVNKIMEISTCAWPFRSNEEYKS